MIINAKGEYLSPFLYDEIQDKGKGLIGVIWDENKETKKADWYDGDGKLILSSDWGMSVSHTGDTMFVYEKGQVDKYDLTGKKIGEEKYQPREKRLYSNFNRETFLYGFVDQDGKLVIPHQYKGADTFEDGRTSASKNGKTAGIIDTLNRVIVPFKYTYIELHPEAKRIFLRKGNKISIVDWNGKSVSPYTYNEIKSARNESGLYLVRRHGNWGMMNEKGQEILPCIYDSISVAWTNKKTPVKKTQRAIIRTNNKWGLLDITTKEVLLPCKYDAIDFINDNECELIKIRYKDKLGVSDLDGNEMIPPLYDYISIESDNRFYVKKDKKTGLLDLHGKTIIPFQQNIVNIANWDGNLFIVLSHN